MEYKDLKQIIDDMGESNLTSLKIEFPDGTKISMKKEEDKKEIIKQEVITSEPEVETKQEKNIVEGNVVKSPMVGTFYSKSSPTANKYVEIGTKVKKGDILCIIEAMKLMNEIESEFDGEVVDILAQDGDMVEYGKPLFVIK